MRARALLVVAAGLLAALALAVPATAGGGAKTKVTIKAESGGFFGFVKSSNPDCTNGRNVTLFQQLGSSQDPHADKKIGSDIAQPNGDGVMWSTGNTGSHSGSFYARAGKTKGCKADTSKTIKAQK
jgi:hypothetical protein